MKKILLVAAFVALSGGSAFAASNTVLVGQTGFFNEAVVGQSASGSGTNLATVSNLGAINVTGISQTAASGVHNTAISVQFGVGNADIITQN